MEFEKENIGLNHLAFGVRSLHELQLIRKGSMMHMCLTAVSKKTNMAKKISFGSTTLMACESSFIAVHPLRISMFLCVCVSVVK